MFSQKLSDKKDGPEEFSSPFRKQESVRTTHKPRFQLQRRKWLKTLQIFPSISSWETPFPYLKLEILLLCQVSTAVFQSCVCVCVCACVCSAMSNSLPPHGLQPTRLLRPWDSPGKSTGVGCHCLLQTSPYSPLFPALITTILNASYLFEFDYSRYLREVDSHGICLFVTALFHFA